MSPTSTPQAKMVQSLVTMMVAITFFGIIFVGNDRAAAFAQNISEDIVEIAQNILPQE